MLTGKFDVYPHEEGAWTALDTSDGDIHISTCLGPETQDGSRERAREVPEQTLRIKIRSDTVRGQEWHSDKPKG